MVDNQMTHWEAACLAADVNDIDPQELEAYRAVPVTGGWEVEFFFLDGTRREFTVLLKNKLN